MARNLANGIGTVCNEMQREELLQELVLQKLKLPQDWESSKIFSGGMKRMEAAMSLEIYFNEAQN